MININKLDLKSKDLTTLDIKIIKEICEVINENEVSKDQFEVYSDIMLEKSEYPIHDVYENDCANGTLLMAIYHKDYLDSFIENNKVDLDNGAIYIIERNQEK